MMTRVYNGADMWYNMFARGKRAGGKTMKKFGKLIFILCLVAVLAVTVAACNEKDDVMGGPDGPRYGITMPSSDIYAIGGEVPEDAAEGTTITFTVTLNDPENSAILGVTVEPTFDASYDIASDNGTYSFVMPASPVKIIIDARAYEEVLSDGVVTFSSSNVTTFEKGAANTSQEHTWVFDIALDWGAYNTAFSRNTEVTSSDQSVIPADAISFEKADFPSDGNWFYGADVKIDTSKVNPGTTWLEMYFQSDNSSSKDGTVCVKVTVLPEKEPEPIVPVEKWTATVKFQMVNYEVEVFQFKDLDHEENTDAKQYQSFYEPGHVNSPQYTVDDDNYVTLTIEYVPEHRYEITIYVSLTGEGEQLYIGMDTSSDGAEYRNGELTFDKDNGSITFTLSRF